MERLLTDLVEELERLGIELLGERVAGVRLAEEIRGVAGRRELARRGGGGAAGVLDAERRAGPGGAGRGRRALDAERGHLLHERLRKRFRGSGRAAGLELRDGDWVCRRLKHGFGHPRCRGRGIGRLLRSGQRCPVRALRCDTQAVRRPGVGGRRRGLFGGSRGVARAVRRRWRRARERRAVVRVCGLLPVPGLPFVIVRRHGRPRVADPR
mmetsp:Transcript_22360/g.71509  ORF Transcript_22360/g.71509 Transcript_22360/m.71509 type:complete len:211 (-) Transcript_22360:176-808(-)